MAGQYRDKEKRKAYQRGYIKGWRLRNKDRLRVEEKLKREKNRLKVITHYTNNLNRCMKCGFDDIRALTVDHINNDGAQHRKILKRPSIYIWLIQNSFPSGFQILCYNCNWIKFIGLQ